MVEWKKIKDVCSNICSGGTPNTKNRDYYYGDIPWLRTQEVDWGNIYDTEIKISQKGLDNSSAKIIEKDCVIVAMYGATAAKVAINKIPLSTNQACCNLKINKDISCYRYVYYWLCKEYHKLKALGEGSQNNISGLKIKDYPIPIPSLSEQNRIVGILDTFTDSIENLKQQIAQRRKQYEFYRDQLLIFDFKINWYELIELCDYVDYRGKTPSKVDHGVFLVTAKNIRKGYIDYENSKEYIPFEDYEIVMRRGKPKKGDVLITTEAPCGNVAQVDDDSIALAQRVIKYRPKDERLNSGYLKYVLLGTDFQMRLDKEATGATAKGIKGSKLHKLQIPLPSLSEQQRIVSILDTFESSISNLEAQLAQRQKQYEYYRNKLLTFE